MRRDARQFNCAFCGKQNETRRGGVLAIYCDRKCRGLAGRRREDNPIRYVDQRGYVRLEYWRDDLGRYVVELEHRRVWSLAGRDIPDGFVIHHANEDKSDNRLENLILLKRGEHTRHHARDLEKYPEEPTYADYQRRWRAAHPEYKPVHAAQERARRAKRKVAL